MKKIKQFFKEKPILAFVLVLVGINVLLGIGAFVYSSTTSREQAQNDKESEDITPKSTKKKSPSPKPTKGDKGDDASEEETESDEADENEEDETDDVSPTPAAEEKDEEPTATPTPANQKNINLYGDLFADANCNGSKDAGEEVLGLETTINLYRLPGDEAYASTKTNRDGHYSYSSTIDADSEVRLQPSAVAPSGYTTPPGFEAESATFSNNNASGQILLPLVPEENQDACEASEE